jgi:hypothetical protein
MAIEARGNVMRPYPVQFLPILLVLLAVSPVNAAETVTYTYDALGRLVRVVVSGTVNNGVQVNYTHDPADNRSNVVVTGAP